MHPSIYRASRTVLIALLLQGLVTACDATAPVDPKSSDGLAPSDASLTVAASGLSAAVVSWSEIDISWAGSPSASGYQVFRSTNGPTGTYVLIATTGATARSYPNTGLTGSTQYCYEVRSFKNAGKNINYSAYTGPVCATTLSPPVVAPSETDAVPEAYRIQVRWKDNSSDEDGFHIERAAVAAGPWVQSVDAPANATSAYVYATTEQQACFRVIAFNAIGQSAPSSPDCTTLPAGPSNLSATALDLQSITLTWTDNTAVEDGYKVSRIEEGGVWSDIATLPPNAVSYRDVGVRSDIAYTYRVQAIKDGGYSNGSNDAIGIISTTAPKAPTNAQVWYYLDTEGYGWNYLTIYWSDASANEDGFRVEYSADGLSGWSLYATADADAYYVQQQISVFDPPPPGGCYRVISFNVMGSSNPSNIACAEPGVVPTDLVATAIDQQSIDLTWTDNASLEKAYVVIRSTAIDGEYSVVADNLPANATSYHDTGLASGQEYWYLVAAIYPDFSWGDWSNYASATTGAGAALQSSRTVVIERGHNARPIRIKGVPRRVPPTARMSRRTP
jgi:titin